MKRVATRSLREGVVVGLLGRKEQVEALKDRDDLEGGAELRDVVDRLIERLENQAGAAPPPVAAR